MKTARWILAYFLCAELLYALYEWQMAGGPQNMNALALGLVLTAILIPSVFVVPLAQFYLGQWLGYVAGDTTPLWPRLIGFQLAVFLNVLLVVFTLRKDLGLVPKKNDNAA